jgi:hypothetical protein
MEVIDQLHNPAALHPQKEGTQYPIIYKAEGGKEPVCTLWTKEKPPGPVGNRTPTVQIVARRYPD